MHITTKLCFALKGTSRKKRFLDSLRLYMQAGPGGMGFPKYGGIGGDGGDIYVVGKEDRSLKNILQNYPTKRITAGHGGNAHQRCIIGSKGSSVTIEAPLGIVLYDQLGNKIGEINNEDDKFKVVSGGLGGCTDTGYSGLKGESQVITLDLKLIADVGLIGFPNAGKSTLLSKISNARPKIASYPFTTLQPELGVLNYKDYRSITIADLPGLIEGAHVNIGMGHKFLKHIERTKLLLVIVDVDGFKLSQKYPVKRTCIETIILLNKELELYRQELLNYPQLLVVNKMDKEGASSIYDEVCETVKHLKDVFFKVPESMRPDQPFNFQRIIGISAKRGDENEIAKVKTYIREILDANADNEDSFEKEIRLMESFSGKLKEKNPKII